MPKFQYSSKSEKPPSSDIAYDPALRSYIDNKKITREELVTLQKENPAMLNILRKSFDVRQAVLSDRISIVTIQENYDAKKSTKENAQVLEKLAKDSMSAPRPR
jgi:hypothetical protein